MGDKLVAVDLGENTVQEVAAGQSHTCVLLTSGEVACFGFNLYGQASARVANTCPSFRTVGTLWSGVYRCMAGKSCIAGTVKFISAGSKVVRKRLVRHDASDPG